MVMVGGAMNEGGFDGRRFAGSANPTQEHLRTHQNNWSIDSSVEVCLVVSGIPRNRGDGTTEWHRRFLRFKPKINWIRSFPSPFFHFIATPPTPAADAVAAVVQIIITIQSLYQQQCG